MEGFTWSLTTSSCRLQVRSLKVSLTMMTGLSIQISAHRQHTPVNRDLPPPRQPLPEFIGRGLSGLPVEVLPPACDLVAGHPQPILPPVDGPLSSRSPQRSSLLGGVQLRCSRTGGPKGGSPQNSALCDEKVKRAWKDSNLRHTAPETVALSPELQAHKEEITQ